MEEHNSKTEIVEIKCDTCGRDMYVRRNSIRDKMFCTLKCMDTFQSKNEPVINV